MKASGTVRKNPSFHPSRAPPGRRSDPGSPDNDSSHRLAGPSRRKVPFRRRILTLSTGPCGSGPPSWRRGTMWTVEASRRGFQSRPSDPRCRRGRHSDRPPAIENYSAFATSRFEAPKCSAAARPVCWPFDDELGVLTLAANASLLPPSGLMSARRSGPSRRLHRAGNLVPERCRCELSGSGIFSKL